MQEYNPFNIDSLYRFNGFLGAELSDDKTEFSVWAPLADSVSVKLYKNGNDRSPKVIAMTKCSNGVWRYTHHQSLKGSYYTYEYTYGDCFQEGVDPYAKAVGINGEKGFICDLSEFNPRGWHSQNYVKLEHYTDAILYEAHVRDFSKDQASGINEEFRGKFKAFTQIDSVTPEGRPTCVSHLKELGITHVHLLPIFDYDRLDESSAEDSYNWGYDPKNYNAPEGSYSTDPFDPTVRIKELKELIYSLHSLGIGVVMDVVYNHTYELDKSVFGKAFPGYYHRYIDLNPSNGSGCGNEIASERAMVRKYIIDSLAFWASEYKIDGFRFDLMACLDSQTMNEAEKVLRSINPNVILYGEGWSGGAVALAPEASCSKDNAEKTPGYAYFNDGYRDAIKGNTFTDTALGYISGNYHLKGIITNGLLGIDSWVPNPSQTINYCEAHDNLTLWDKLALSAGSYHDRDRKKMSRLAFALVILAQGIPFIHAGQEFLRSKALGGGKYDHNSYNSPDSVNALKWAMLDKNYDEVDYFKRLIHFRKDHRLLRMPTRVEVESHSEVLNSSDGTIAIKLFNEVEQLLIYVNPIPRAKPFVLPDGEWELLISDSAVSEKPMATLCEGVFVPPISVMVLKLRKE